MDKNGRASRIGFKILPLKGSGTAGVRGQELKLFCYNAITTFSIDAFQMLLGYLQIAVLSKG